MEGKKTNKKPTTTKQPKRGKPTAGAKTLPKFINSNFYCVTPLSAPSTTDLPPPAPPPTAHPPVFTRCQRDGRSGLDACNLLCQETTRGRGPAPGQGPAAAPATPRPSDTRGPGTPPWAWTGASPAHRGPPRV